MTTKGRCRAGNYFLGLLAALCCAEAAADSPPLLSVERIFHDNEFELNEPVSSKWLADGASYTTIEKSVSTPDGFDIVQHNSATGKETILVAASRLVPDKANTPLEIKDYSWSDDGQFMRHLYGLMTDFLHEKLPPSTSLESPP